MTARAARIAIVTVSDRAAAGIYEDKGGPGAEDWLRGTITSPMEIARHIIPDGRDGVAATHDSDLRDLLGLVSTIRTVRPLLVNVTAPLDALIERARESERWDAAAVEAMARAFESSLPSPAVLDTSELSPEEGAERIMAHLGAS